MECAQKKFQYLIEHPSHRHTKSDSNCSHCQHLGELDQQLEKAIKQLNEYWSLIKKFNQPEAVQNKKFQALSEQVFVELTELAQYTYQDIDGQTKPLLTNEEIEQLMLPRGNLTPAERLAIESHVTHSYEFLKQFLGQNICKIFPILPMDITKNLMVVVILED